MASTPRAIASPWPAASPLFPPLPPEAARLLKRFPDILAAVRPLNAAHRRDLPGDVAALSRLLTTERASLCKPYWGSPAAISAYLYYFLPWNLVRLTRLLAALPLPDPRTLAPAGGEALLLDAGSGPLTLPLALWLARPAWREAPVRVLALDVASQPLRLGQGLLEGLGRMTGQRAWPVNTARAPLDQAGREAASLLLGGKLRPWLVTAVNVLNELRGSSRPERGTGTWDKPETAGGESDNPAGTGARLEERLERLLATLAPLLDPGGGSALPDPLSAPALLFVEPGTRLGGGTVTRLRRLALDGGLSVLAPCPHRQACPLERGHTWCHFTFDSTGAPLWLTELSQAARLGKDGLSLAPLLLSAVPPESGAPAARVLSSPFLVPGLAGRARYACAQRGLLLLEGAERLKPGDLLSLDVPVDAPRDRKSGALLLRAAAQGGGAAPGGMDAGAGSGVPRGGKAPAPARRRTDGNAARPRCRREQPASAGAPGRGRRAQGGGGAGRDTSSAQAGPRGTQPKKTHARGKP